MEPSSQYGLGVPSSKPGSCTWQSVSEDKIVVEGVNLAYKHVRRSQQNPQGGRIQKEAAIALSNVLPYCEKCERGVKVRVEIKDGIKERICKSCSTPLPV